MGKLKNKLIDDEDRKMAKITKVYIVQRVGWLGEADNMRAFSSYEKALDYCDFVKDLYEDCDYEFEIEGLDLEE